MPKLPDLQVPVRMSDDFSALETTMEEMRSLMSQACKCLIKATSLMDKIKDAALKPFDDASET